MTRAEILQLVAAGKLSVAEADRLLSKAAPGNWRRAIVFYGVFVNVTGGVIFLTVGVWLGVCEIQFRLKAQSTEGTVIRLHQTGMRDDTSPIVQFEADGKKYEMGTRVGPMGYFPSLSRLSGRAALR